MSMFININNYAGGEELLKERNGELVEETLPSRQNQLYPAETYSGLHL